MHTDIDQQKEAVVRRLRQLPDEMRPPYNWQEFQRRSRQRTTAARGGAARSQLARGSETLDGRTRRYAAIAAVLVAVAAGIAVWNHIAEFEPDPARVAANGDPDLQLSAARSTAIEGWLASLPREPAVVHVGTRAAVAGLEDRIAQVDDLLTAVRLDRAQPDRLAALQQERVRLVGSLAQVRYAEVVAAGSL
jgi:hypothetical protein